jgi:quercetin dioxygenase-like cupin family protein
MPVETQERERTRYVYDYEALDRAPGGSCSATITPRRFSAGKSCAGAVVTGQRAQVSLVRQARGTGYEARTCTGEQFKYVLQGTLIADIDGQALRVPKGHVLHIPAGMLHGLVTGSEDDAVMIAVTDTRAPAGEHPDVARLDAPSTPQSPRTSGTGVRYVYAIDELDNVPEGPCSAVVTPKNFVSGKSSSYGAALKGEMLQVGLIRKARGSGAKLHTHPNEQFNLVLEGKLVGEIAGHPMEVPAGSIIHMPARVEHCTLASADGDVLFFVVKDTSHGMAGPPVDGVEDGPRFLPGFGPGAVAGKKR